jgi:hypothetical protein
LKGRKGSKDLPVRPDRQVRRDLKETKVSRAPLVSSVHRVRLARREALARQALRVHLGRPALPARRACMR